MPETFNPLSTLRLPDGGALSLYRTLDVNFESGQTLTGLALQITTAAGAPVVARTGLWETLGPNNSLGVLSGEISGVLLQTDGTLDLWIEVSEPGLFDPVTNTYSGSQTFTTRLVKVDVTTGDVLSATEIPGPNRFGQIINLNSEVLLTPGRTLYLQSDLFLSQRVPTAFDGVDAGRADVSSDATSPVVAVAGGFAVATQNSLPGPGGGVLGPGLQQIHFIAASGPVGSLGLQELPRLRPTLDLMQPEGFRPYVLFGHGLNGISMAGLADGRLVVAYAGYIDAGTGIWMNIIDPANPAAQAPPVMVRFNSVAIEADPFRPAVFALQDGGFAIAYETDERLATLPARLLHFDAAGREVAERALSEGVYGLVVEPDGTVYHAASGRITLFDALEPGPDVNGSGTPSAGDDTLIGTAGSDTLDGLAGNDRIEGMDGTDTLDGGAGDDFIYGGASVADLRDVIYGGIGHDSIDGGHGNDDLNGGDGNDTILGGFGSDTVIGNAGNDLLAGGAGSDLMFAGPGDDTLNGGFGYDRLNGSEGADRFYHQGVAGHASDWVQDYTAFAGDLLQVGLAGATRAQFQVNTTFTAGAGAAGVAKAFVIYRPTGQILWALVDGAAQDQINIQIGGQVFDLLG